MEEIVQWTVGNYALNAKTLVMTWITMAILLVFVYLGVRKLTSGTPGKMQNLLEWVVDFVRNLISQNLDYRIGGPWLSYLVTLILFIFFSNMIGLIPNIFAPIFQHVEFAGLNQILGHATLQSPTADINTDLALALLTISIVIGLGIKNNGIHYFGHFFKPSPLFAPIHIIDLVAKPMTLAFRLFGNIYAGEMLIAVILMIPGFFVLGGIIPMPIWLAFCVFIAVIQSYVFTILTIAYIGQAVEKD